MFSCIINEREHIFLIVLFSNVLWFTPIINMLILKHIVQSTIDLYAFIIYNVYNNVHYD